MATPKPEALARKAHALQARLSKQHARLIAAANKIARTNGRSGSAFSAGAKFGASIFERPRQALRAKSSEGKVAFHFRMTPVTRGSEFTDMIAGRSASKAGGGDTATLSRRFALSIKWSANERRRRFVWNRRRHFPFFALGLQLKR